jgi:two-component system, chemotaxis family, chemotaxis protein CheY
MISSPPKKKLDDRKSRRVLYVDDMRELRDVARLALSKSGHKIECAPDGVDAFEMIKANHGAYDIVISDHHMATMNGLELATKLRELKYPGMIAIVSSELSELVADEYRSIGVERILYKPVALADLRSLVLESEALPDGGQG